MIWKVQYLYNKNRDWHIFFCRWANLLQLLNGQLKSFHSIRVPDLTLLNHHLLIRLHRVTILSFLYPSSISPIVCCLRLNNTRKCMSIYSDKLAQVQVELNCLYSAAPKCTQRYARPGFGIPGCTRFSRWRHELSLAHNNVNQIQIFRYFTWPLIGAHLAYTWSPNASGTSFA